MTKKAGLSGESSLGNLAGKAEQAYHEATGTAQPESHAETAAAKPEPVSLSGRYQTASGGGISYEVPEEFEEFDSGAVEVQLSYVYGDGDTPYICIQDVGGGLPSASEPSGRGIMKSFSGGWINWRGEKIRYYVFTDTSGSDRLLLVSGTGDEAMNLMIEKVLDHAADTLKLS